MDFLAGDVRFIEGDAHVITIVFMVHLVLHLSIASDSLKESYPKLIRSYPFTQRIIVQLFNQ